MNLIKLIILAVVFASAISCKKHKQIENEKPDPTAKDIADLYRYESIALADEHGYIDGLKCDATSFTALYCIHSGLPKDECPVYKSESATEPGKWFRHAEQNCFDKGESASDNSRDQFIFLALMFWHYKDLANVEEILEYGERNNFIMGRSKDPVVEYTRSRWGESFRAIYYELRRRLGGQSGGSGNGGPRGNGSLLRVPTPTRDFTSHLQLNRLLLFGMWGGLNKLEIDWLKKQSKKEPNNAVAQMIRSRFDKGHPFKRGYKVMLEKFPPYRLPNNKKDFCTHYLYQRDEDSGKGSNWEPCPEKKFEEYPGNDFGWAECIARDGCLRGT